MMSSLLGREAREVELRWWHDDLYAAKGAGVTVKSLRLLERFTFEFASKCTPKSPSETMLPNLSDEWGSRMQVLRPSTSESASASTRRNALLELKKIDSVRVSSSGKGSNVRYAVEVTVDSPTATGCLGLSIAASETTVRSERELSEFKALANELHGVVNSAHPGQRCEFCSAVLNWFVFGENPDGLLLRFVGSERVARKLTKFLEDLLALTVKYASVESQGSCSGHMLMPQVVHKFLFNPPTCDAA